MPVTGSSPAGSVVARTRILTRSPTHPTSKEAALTPQSTPAVETSGLVKRFRRPGPSTASIFRCPSGRCTAFWDPTAPARPPSSASWPPCCDPTPAAPGCSATEADAVRRRVSLPGQYAAVDNDLTGRENLVLLARLLGFSPRQARTRAGELLDAFGLAEAADRLVNTYSGGMRRRLDLTASLIVTPQLLVLDEPTTGLDPHSRNQVWDIVRALAAGGTTVLLTTQYLEEADQLADRIAVLDRGRVIAEGTPGELKASVGAGALHVRLPDPTQRAHAQRLLSRALGVPVHPTSDPAGLSVRVADSRRVVDALAELAGAGIPAADFALGQPSLDEVFLALTGQPSRSSTITKEDAA